MRAWTIHQTLTLKRCERSFNPNPGVNQIHIGIEIGNHLSGATGKKRKPSGRNLHPKRIRHDVLNLMSLIEDHQIMLRQHMAASTNMLTIEMGVHHYHIGFGGLLAGLLCKT